MSAPAKALNFSIRPNVTPETLLAKKEEAINLAISLALKKGLAKSPSELAIQDIAPEDLGLSGDNIAWSAPANTGWNKVVSSVKVENKIVVFYGVKSVSGDPAVGIRFTQGKDKDLAIRGEYHLHTIYNNVEREANGLFPELVPFSSDEYMNIYIRFKSTDASNLIPLAVVVKPKTEVVG